MVHPCPFPREPAGVAVAALYAWRMKRACSGRLRDMKRTFLLGIVLAAGASVVGCVDQRYLITSDPPGAMVLRNGVPIGPTPVDDQFVYYGNYHFTLAKDGYETLQVDQDIPAPWYEYAPLDFVNEVLNPFKLHDVQAFHYEMRKAEPPNKEDVINRGQELRNRGQSLIPADGAQPDSAPPSNPPTLGPPLPMGPPRP
jgi:hypothetical protein